ncbi:MAG: hypothetical protein ACK504_00535 [Bacteroidota bacterium]|jgi:hypothetical protein
MLLAAHLYFFPTQKAKQKNPKVLASQRLWTSQIWTQSNSKDEKAQNLKI